MNILNRTSAIERFRSVTDKVGEIRAEVATEQNNNESLRKAPNWHLKSKDVMTFKAFR